MSCLPTSKSINTSFFNKKTVVTFFLSVLIVLLHVTSFEGYNYQGALGSAISFFGSFVTEGITSVAIRLFFIISGVLFYRNYTYKTTAIKLKSRFKTLVIPYLIWCVFYTVVMMVVDASPLGGFIAVEADFTVKNLFLGVFFNYFYKSLWFIFNLIIFTLLCPVIYTLLSNKYIGGVVVSAITVLYAFGIRIPETVMIAGEEYIVFWRADSIIFYLIGAYVGMHFFDWFSKRKSKAVSVVSLILFLMCSLYITLADDFNLYNEGFVYILIMTVFCFSTWFMFDLFTFDKKPKHFCNYSFMMFALNFYLAVYVAKVLHIVLPKSQIFAIVNLILTLIIVIGFILLSSAFMEKYLPKVYKLITGNR